MRIYRRAADPNCSRPAVSGRHTGPGHAAWRQSAVATRQFQLEKRSVAAADCAMLDRRSHHYPRRPPRLQSLFANTRPFYFVTFNTYKRLPLLAHPEIHEAFRSLCFCAQERDVAVGRYVLMPDHTHLFVAMPPEAMTLANWIQALRSVMGKRLLRCGFQKPHWQEGFFDHVLRSGESYSQKWEYVRMNPVRAGLSETPDEWPYQGEIMSLPFD
jgi:putative transposase